MMFYLNLQTKKVYLSGKTSLFLAQSTDLDNKTGLLLRWEMLSTDIREHAKHTFTAF